MRSITLATYKKFPLFKIIKCYDLTIGASMV